MFRAVVLSIVLTLVAGSPAWLACGSWCQSGANAGGCEHTEPPGRAAADNCPDMTSTATASVPEDARRGSPAHPDDGATPFHATPPPQLTRLASLTAEPQRFTGRTVSPLRI